MINLMINSKPPSMVRNVGGSLWSSNVKEKIMELIILNDGMYHLIPVTKQMTDGIVLISSLNCYDLCDILRLKLTTYAGDPLNAHVMNDDSGDFFGCICK